jgi:hypothetical protein
MHPTTQQAWLSTRRDLNARRYELSQLAAAEGPPIKIPGTSLLAPPSWLPAQPIPLEDVELRWDPAPAPPVLDGGAPELDPLRPRRADGTPYRRYHEALGDLARPGLFQNRACYRLLSVGPDSGTPVLTYGPGRYFDHLDVCEALAHEFAAAHPVDSPPRPTPFRKALKDPTDLHRRPLGTAISTLTIREDRRAGTAEFVLHWRDPSRVASGGNMYQVMPVGMFQPSDDAAWNEGNDFDLWRSMLREFSEELLDGSEDYGSDRAPIDYAGWEFSAALDQARREGTLRVWWLGLGLDPLTLTADLLTVAVFEAELFDRVFAGLVTGNSEGHRVGGQDGAAGLPLDAAQVERLTSREPMQAPGAALLRLAWAHRATLLDRPRT